MEPAKVKKGTIIYVPEIYIEVKGERKARVLAEILLVEESVFFVVEPLPFDEYRFYFKKEFSARAEKILDEDLPKVMATQCHTLSASETQRHIERHGGDYWFSESKDHPEKDWLEEILNGDTRQGYWEWLYYKEMGDKWT